jgi:cytochrome b
VTVHDRCMVWAEQTIGLENHFGHTSSNSLVTWVMWNLVSVCLETGLMSVQDRCTVCTKCIIGS